MTQASGLLQIGHKLEKWQWRHNFWNYVIIVFWGCFLFLVKFSYWFKFHAIIITGSCVITIFFIRNWPEIRKSEIPPSRFCPISINCGKLRISNLVRMSLEKWMQCLVLRLKSWSTREASCHPPFIGIYLTISLHMLSLSTK